MRWIFVLLLALNVIYFGREFDREMTIRNRQAALVTPVPASAQRLQLLSELSGPPAARTIEVEPVAVEATDAEPDPLPNDQLVTELPDIALPPDAPVILTWSCYRYGPLLDEDQLDSLQQWFTARNVQAEPRFIEEQGRQLFWIYLAPQPSRENAMAVLQEMQNKGIGDFRLINRGDLQNAISLGLFSSREAVNARLEELQEKGYVPVVVPYADVKRIYSLDVRIVNTGDIYTEMRQGYPARFESVPVECAALAITESGPEPAL